MKRLTLPILIAVCATFLMIGVMGAKEHTVVLENKYGNVTFDHQKHAGLDCQACHHNLKAGEEAPQPCSDCHNESADISSKNAFHDTCKDCHKEQGQGPTKCRECHQK